MDKVFSNDLTRLLLMLTATVVALTALTARIIGKTKGTFKPYRKQTLIYLVVAFIFFSVIALTAHPFFFPQPTVALICFQVYFLLLGIAHVFFLRQNLQWSGSNNMQLSEMLFTLLVGLFGSIGFLLLYYVLNKNGLQYMMAASILFFIIPYFFYQSFTRAVSIPPKVVNEWYYPVDQEVEEPDDSKLKNMRVISFEFIKRSDSSTPTNFRAKAPIDMDFGQLFYYFINDYNERHPNSKVEFINGNGEPQGWIFYKKPTWHSVTTRYIDPDKTVFNNRIKENDVIICSRSLT